MAGTATFLRRKHDRVFWGPNQLVTEIRICLGSWVDPVESTRGAMDLPGYMIAPQHIVVPCTSLGLLRH